MRGLALTILIILIEILTIKNVIAQTDENSCYYLKIREICRYKTTYRSDGTVAMKGWVYDNTSVNEFESEKECRDFVRTYYNPPPGSYRDENCELDFIYYCAPCDQVFGTTFIKKRKEKKVGNSSSSSGQNVNDSKNVPYSQKSLTKGSHTPPNVDPQPHLDQRVSGVVPQYTPSDAEKLTGTILKATPGILDAIGRHNAEKRRRNAENHNFEGKPEGFHSTDELSEEEQEWLMETEYNLEDRANEVAAAVYEEQWANWIQKQPARPGEDGFISTIPPVSDHYAENPEGIKYYFVNGVLNEFVEARNSAQMIANEIGQPVVLIYSASTKQNDHPLPVSPDAVEAIAYRLGAGSQGTSALATSLFLDLSHGKEVRVFAHSRGAALTYNAVTDLHQFLISTDMNDRMGNLEVITLGGFNPPSAKWAYGAKVVDVANQYDAIPWLAGHGAAGTHLGNISLDSHPIATYKDWIKFFGQSGIPKEVFDIRSFPTMLPPDEFMRK